MVRWAVQEQMLPTAATEGFGVGGRRRVPVRALSFAPITTEQLVRLIGAADLYQLVLFSFHMFHGVRVAEPCWLMVEFFDRAGGWIDYRCIEELGYRTKGAVDKRLPVPELMARGITAVLNGRIGGPLLLKRRSVGRRGKVPAKRANLARIIESVHARSPAGWSGRLLAASERLKRIGVIDGDDIRRVLVANGDWDKAIWITEYGWSTPDEALKARLLPRALAELNSPSLYYVTVACYLSLTDPPGEKGYGLCDKDLKPRPAYMAFKAYTQARKKMLERSAARARLQSPGSTSGGTK